LCERAAGVDWQMLLAVVASLAVAFVCGWIRSWRAEKRQGKWRVFASSLGLKWKATDPLRTALSWPHPMFHRGRRRLVRNWTSGSYRGLPVRCFDYRYSVSYGQEERTYSYTVVALVPPIPFAPLVVRPETLGDRLAAAAGFDDIDFESDEFSRRYYVKSRDRQFAYGVLHQKAMEYLLSLGPIIIEGDAPAVLFLWAQEGFLDLPDGPQELLDAACGFLELLPGYMVQDGKAGLSQS